MHRVLYIQEILQQVFHHFLPEAYINALSTSSHGPFDLADEYGRSNILNFALTCRAFKEPALDALWWAMDDLTPLLDLLKGYQVVEDGLGMKRKVIRGFISTSEHETFSAYAKRIKLYHFYHHHDIPITTYIQLLQSCNRTHILPSLKYLLCESNAPELLFFLSPGLREVKAWFKEVDLPAQHCRALVASLPQSAPQITGLSLNYDMSQECLESITIMPNLKHLYLHNSLPQKMNTTGTILLNPRILQKLLSSSSGALSQLSIYGDIEITIGASAMSPLLFPSLEEIDVQPRIRKEIFNLTKFFQIAALPRLRSLTIAKHDARDFANFKIEDWQDLVKSLVQSAQNLQSLSIGLRSIRTGLRFENIPEILRLPLLSLEECILDPVTVTDIRSMAAAWPHLTQLCICSRIGFDVLIEIARSFPALQKLNVMCNFQAIPNLGSVPILANRLSLLIVRIESLVPQPDPGKVAFLIDRLFPCLQNLIIPGVKSGQHGHESWLDIGKIIKYMHHARMDERVRQLNGLQTDGPIVGEIQA